MTVRELLDRPERWTKGVMARDQTTGQEVNPRSEFATCWCLHGAIVRVYGTYSNICHLVRRALKTELIGEWNDAPGRTFEEVRELVERLDI